MQRQRNCLGAIPGCGAWVVENRGSLKRLAPTRAAEGDPQTTRSRHANRAPNKKGRAGACLSLPSLYPLSTRCRRRGEPRERASGVTRKREKVSCVPVALQTGLAREGGESSPTARRFYRGARHPAPFPRFRGKGGSFLQDLGEPWGREAGCSAVSLHRVRSARACVGGGGKKAAKADSAAVGRT